MYLRRCTRPTSADRRPRPRRRCGRRCAATATRTRDWSDGGSPIREMAGPRATSATTTSCSPTTRRGSPSPTGCRPSGCDEQLDVVAELNDDAPSCRGTRFRHPHRHRGRHPRGRLARPEAVAARPARRRRRQRALQAAHAVAGDDAADGRRHRQPAHRRPRPLHRTADHRRPRHPARVGVRRRDRVRGLRRSSASPSRSTPGPSGSTRRSGCCAWPSRPAAWSPSTPTRTRPVSSTGRSTAASARRGAACRRRVDRQHLGERRPAGLDRRPRGASRAVIEIRAGGQPVPERAARASTTWHSLLGRRALRPATTWRSGRSSASTSTCSRPAPGSTAHAHRGVAHRQLGARRRRCATRTATASGRSVRRGVPLVQSHRRRDPAPPRPTRRTSEPLRFVQMR